MTPFRHQEQGLLPAGKQIRWTFPTASGSRDAPRAAVAFGDYSWSLRRTERSDHDQWKNAFQESYGCEARQTLAGLSGALCALAGSLTPAG